MGKHAPGIVILDGRPAEGPDRARGSPRVQRRLHEKEVPGGDSWPGSRSLTAMSERNEVPVGRTRCSQGERR